MVPLDPGHGDAGGRVEWVIPLHAIEFEFRRRGQVLFVDTDGTLKIWGRPSQRLKVMYLLDGREDEMARYLIARAMRGEEIL